MEGQVDEDVKLERAQAAHGPRRGSLALPPRRPHVGERGCGVIVDGVEED